MEHASDKKLLEILQKEEFLAFFDFRKIGADGKNELEGLCKITSPHDESETDHIISLIFVFDTPGGACKANAVRAVSKLKMEEFKKEIPSVYAVTSVPAAIMQNPDVYVHQLDVIFSGKSGADLRETVGKLVFTIRRCADFDTEVPQWWNEGGKSEGADPAGKKCGWAARIKAFLGAGK